MKKIIGIVLMFLGIAFILNSGIFLTGLVIADTGSDLNYIFRGGSFIGAVLLLIGGILVVSK